MAIQDLAHDSGPQRVGAWIPNTLVAVWAALSIVWGRLAQWFRLAGCGVCVGLRAWDGAVVMVGANPTSPDEAESDSATHGAHSTGPGLDGGAGDDVEAA